MEEKLRERVTELGKIVNRRINYSRECGGDFLTHPKPYAYSGRKRKEAINNLREIKKATSDEDIKKSIEKELSSCGINRFLNPLGEIMERSPFGSVAWASLCFVNTYISYQTIKNVYDYIANYR